jgi:hypothetical protein
MLTRMSTTVDRYPEFRGFFGNDGIRNFCTCLECRWNYFITFQLTSSFAYTANATGAVPQLRRQARQEQSALSGFE